MRHCHYLKPNHRSETLHEFVSLDTETLQEMALDGAECHRLWFGWASYDRSAHPGRWMRPRWLRFERKRAFWRWVDSLTRPKVTLYLFCHNSAFDYVILDAFQELQALGWKVTWGIIDQLPFVVKAVKGTSKLVLLDTLNWWRTSLASLGESVGVSKLSMPAPDATRKTWDTYCRQDVEVIRRAVRGWRDFLVREDLGKFRMTLAGQSMQCYRHRFMTHRILVHAHSASLKLEREAYHGGRTELFYHGPHVGKFYHLDVNSMYPAVMKAGLFPCRWYGYHRQPDPQRFRSWLKLYSLVARCRIKTRQPIYAMMLGGKLVFPVGEFETVLTTEEIKLALRRHHLQEVMECSLYQKAPLFREFVDYLYAHRLRAQASGDPVRSFQFKIMMNSLYGKWGQSGRVWETVATTPDLTPSRTIEVDVETGEVKHLSRVAGLIQEYREEPESRESVPGIAAEVTAQARLLLWRIIEQAGVQNVYYCDTDSVLVNRAGYRRLKARIHPTRLGYLKLENTYRRIELRGAKDYTFDAVTKIKGIRHNAVELAPDVFVQDRWPGWAGLIRSGRVDQVKVYRIEKHLSRLYTKGVIESSTRVSPLVISRAAPPAA